MATLEQLLDNFRHAAIEDYWLTDKSEEKLKAAQEAIVAHVEGAMGAALRFGQNDSVHGAKERTEAWEGLLERWTK